MNGIYLTESEAIALRDYIDIDLVPSIADSFNDGEDTSLLWLYNMLSIYKKCGGLEQFADYVPEENNIAMGCHTCIYNGVCYHCLDDCGDCDQPCASCKDGVFNNWECKDELKQA